MSHSPGPPRRINAGAYQALVEALAVVFWHKKPFERFVRRTLRDLPELLAQVDFDQTKRETAGAVVDWLMRHEARHRDVTLELMLEIAAMESFPDLATHEDAESMTDRASAAVRALRKYTDVYAGIVDERRRAAEAREREAERATSMRSFADVLTRLRGDFVEMQRLENPQRRGREFEGLLNQLFALFDLCPRGAFRLSHEQIDGAFTFDTDDYIVEAKWEAAPIERGELDKFGSILERKAKYTLGLMISVNGFSRGAVEMHRRPATFLMMDGSDLMAVLDDRVRLDDLLRRKKRHASETGEPFFAASRMLLD